MPLEPGAHFGPYEIVGPAGAGGMGEVYRARDTRLDRTVALKVLPPDLTNDPTARQRFEREARAGAALSHPHICTLHDIGHQDGTDYLVMEYLTGDAGTPPYPRQAARGPCAPVRRRDRRRARGRAHRRAPFTVIWNPGRDAPPALEQTFGLPRGEAARTTVVSGQTMTTIAPLTGPQD